LEISECYEVTNYKLVKQKPYNPSKYPQFMNNQVEIMAPAGSYESLQAAIKAGANSVYFGIEQLNMRARAANNFTTEDLKKIVSICKKSEVKTYLTVNTILYDHDITLMKKIVDTAKEAGITAIIASDISTIQYAHEKNVEVHISTQCNISNIEAVKFYSKYADVVVLARELTLKQIQHICDEIKKQNIQGPKGNLIEVEIFAHGALCVAVSGICYMGLAQYNSSANRGACLQPCRRSYKITDEETGEELILDNKYIMSPKDLCTIGFLDQILATGIKVLKLEGRGRSPDYVYTIVKAYKEATNSIPEGTYTKEKIESWTKELESVFNRGFWHGGYYLGKKLGEWSGTYGSKSTKEKTFMGLAEHYFPKSRIAQFKIQKEELNLGDEIIITGETTGVIKSKISSLYVNEQPTKTAKKGDTITISLNEKVRKGDKLYIVKDRKKLQHNPKLKVIQND
tara:strand:+ start:1168 stop:2535 length:1368 start_codon:yes stop_codon:yes gene_type:complete